MKMQRMAYVVIASVTAALLMMALSGLAQEKLPRQKVYQAQAFGQSTQAGRNFGVTIRISALSSPADQQALIDAFNKSGNKGVYDALRKMTSKGKIAITGTPGYDVVYARQVESPEGTKIRLLTSRPILFGETSRTDRSYEYNISALEMNVTSDPDKTTGTLLPAIKFKVSKQKELEIEAFQNPWRLSNILDRSDD